MPHVHGLRHLIMLCSNSISLPKVTKYLTESTPAHGVCWVSSSTPVFPQNSLKAQEELLIDFWSQIRNVFVLCSFQRQGKREHSAVDLLSEGYPANKLSLAQGHTASYWLVTENTICSICWNLKIKCHKLCVSCDFAVLKYEGSIYTKHVCYINSNDRSQAQEQIIQLILVHLGFTEHVTEQEEGCLIARVMKGSQFRTWKWGNCRVSYYIQGRSWTSFLCQMERHQWLIYIRTNTLTVLKWGGLWPF